MFTKMRKVDAVKSRICRKLMDQSGASAVEIALAAVIAIVLACILLEAFTGIFSNSIIPGIQEKITQMFAITG